MKGQYKDGDDDDDVAMADAGSVLDATAAAATAATAAAAAAATGAVTMAEAARRRKAAGDAADAEVSEEALQYFQTQYLDKPPKEQGGAYGFVGRGLYYAQIKLWLRQFPPEQVLVMSLGDQSTVETRQAEVNRAFAFAGLPPHEIPDTGIKNSRQYDTMPPEMRKKLTEFYAPHNRQLYSLIGRDLGWARP